jgi:quinol monooxygenase YgiN
MYTLSVTLDVHPDKVDEFVDAISVNAAALRDESGCLVFDVHRDVENPTRFYLYEVYTTKTHSGSPTAAPRITRAGRSRDRVRHRRRSLQHLRPSSTDGRNRPKLSASAGAHPTASMTGSSITTGRDGRVSQPRQCRPRRGRSAGVGRHRRGASDVGHETHRQGLRRDS